jgi:site-specific DNA recombinase
MKTDAIYTRKSIYIGKGESIENQITVCKDYLKRLEVNDYVIYARASQGKALTYPNSR